MGLFRRSRREPEPGPGPTGPALSTGAAPAVAGGSDAFPVQRAAMRDATPAWRSAAPMIPTVTPPASTFKIGAAVKEDLVALASPRLSHGMGHLAGDDGPAGVVGGLATVVVQRRAAHDGDDGEPPVTGPAGTPVPHHSGSADMPVVARTGDDNGHRAGDTDGRGDTASGLADEAWHARVVPRIVPAGGHVGPERPARPVDAPQVDAPARHLPLVTPPAPVQRHADADGSVHDGGDAESPTPHPDARPDGVDGLGADLPGPAVPPPDDPPGDASADGYPASTGDISAPTAIQRATGDPQGPAPRPGALGPPLDTAAGPSPDAAVAPAPPIGATSLQRRAADPAPPPSTVGDGPGNSLGGGAAVMDLAIRQRPRPGARPGGDPDAVPTVARSLAGPVPGGLVPPPTPADTPTSRDGASLPLVQRVLDDHPSSVDGPSDQAATPTDLGTTVPDPVADLPDRGGAPGDSPTGAVPVDAPGPTDTPLPTGTSDVDAAPSPSLDGDEGDAAAPTVRSTLGLDAAVSAAGPVSPTADAAPAIGGDVPPLPLPIVQRRSDDGQPAGHRAVGGTIAGTSGPGLEHRASAPSQATGAPPPAHLTAAPPGPPVTTLPLVAQRSLAPAPSLGDALATRRPSGTTDTAASDESGGGRTATPVATWPSPAGTMARGTGSPGAAAPPSIQRWPDLGSVTDAGRDALGAASGAARERARALADRGRQAATDRLPGGMPDLPDVPGAGSLPALDLARPPQIPGMPSAADLPDIPGVGDLPGGDALPGVPAFPGLAGTPALPSLPGGATATAAAAGVPMTEIAFPSPASADAAGGGAATAPVASPAGAAAGAAGAGAGGGDLDELAHKLYDRIRWRMRAELRLDRERAGLGAGVRH